METRLMLPGCLRRLAAAVCVSIAAMLVALPSDAASMPGLAELSGSVKGTSAGALSVVSAHDLQRDVSYTVFVVDGKYRATNLRPGDYEVSVRPAVGQRVGFEPVLAKIAVSAGQKAILNFKIGPVAPVKNYVGGLPYAGDPRYPDAKVLPYDQVFPPGPGRDILERTCNACHAVNFIPYNVPRDYSGGRGPKNREAWADTVDRMHKGPAFGRRGKAPIVDASLLPPADRQILVDYLATNFGEHSEPRVVQLESEPRLESKALERAMFIEYNYHEPAGKYDAWPWPHQVDFDAEGNVWLAYTACCIVRFDPRTGKSKAFEGHGGGHGIAVDQSDGTVWYSGDTVRRLDPRTGRVDHWKLGNDRMLGSNTQVFDSKGNLWMSLLTAGGIAKWDRASDSIVWWEVPVVRSRPYGIIVDNFDKVWFADYHNGGVTRFDPETEQFRHYPLVKERSASSIRRLGVDSKNNIWAATWASLKYVAKLYRLDPTTAAVMERAIDDLPYAAAYNAEPDSHDNIWVANDNYLSMYDPRADRFTHYPVPVRSDTLKTTIDRDDGVWFIYRNAGKFLNYGGTAAVLHRDKDRIRSFAAYPAIGNQGQRLANFRGPAAPPVRGGDRVSPAQARNAAAYEAWARENGLLETDEPPLAAAADVSVPRVAATPASIQPPDPAMLEAGRRLFASNCGACHSVDRDAAAGIAPPLWGVLGRRAGSVPGFSYSDRMRRSGIVWNRELLSRFIAAPGRFLPGTLMASIGVSSPQDQAAIVAYLEARALEAAGAARSSQRDATSERE